MSDAESIYAEGLNPFIAAVTALNAGDPTIILEILDELTPEQARETLASAVISTRMFLVWAAERLDVDIEVLLARWGTLNAQGQ